MIRFEGVTFSHPNGPPVLREIDLTIGAGELIAIVGENGAGKTTLVKHTNGLLKPSKGKVTVFGLDTKTASIAELSRRVGMVFQNADHQLFSETVEEELVFGLRNFGYQSEVIDERKEWALRFGQLEEYRQNSPMTLSGGEKKRLCLAAVLTWNPDAVVLDEPTVGQDFGQKERLSDIIRLLLSQGRTVILVSHDIEFLWPLQPRVVVMNTGRIVLDGKASETLTREDVLTDSRVLPPQLVKLSNSLCKKPTKPFVSVSDAKERILSSVKVK